MGATSLAAVVPNGVPLGVVLLGVSIGALYALSALGLVLVYRFHRIINFAQAELGGLASVAAVLVFARWGVPYPVAVLIGLAVAVAAGALVQLGVIRRLERAPALILTVATIALAQLLGGLQVALPNWFGGTSGTGRFSSGIESSWQVGAVRLGADHVLAVVVALCAVVALRLFLTRAHSGVAMLAIADNRTRAQLLGVPVERISMITWMVAAGLSGLGSILAIALLGPSVGGTAGATALLVPLTAAVIGRMSNVVVTVIAALGLGVFQQVVLWNYPQSSALDVAMFVLICASLLLRSRRSASRDGSPSAPESMMREPALVPRVIAALPEVRSLQMAAAVVVLVLCVGLPLVVSTSMVTVMTYVVVFAIVAVSLVVLTGWGGQMSLGQFGLAGIGAAATAALMVSVGVDVFVALGAAVLVGSLAALVVGLPALRLPGHFLAVTTLAFGTMTSTYVLNDQSFPVLTPARVSRPVLFDRIDLGATLTFYFFCLLWLFGVIWVARNFRRSRAGRVTLAVRDNERMAASVSILPSRTKLVAFMTSGALCGLAGGLYVIGLRGMPFSGFDPSVSIAVFSMAVIGGVVTIPGAILGAIYVESARYFLDGSAELFATGAGLLVVLLVAPGGLWEIILGLRDRLLAVLARRRGIEVDVVAPRVDASTRGEGALRGGSDGRWDDPGRGAGWAVERSLGEAPRLVCDSLEAGYGRVQVLFGVDLQIERGEIVALVGTNGAGKSTLLKAIAGVLAARGGEISLSGSDPDDQTLTDLSAASPRARVDAGIVLASGGEGVFASLRVDQNLEIARWWNAGELTGSTDGSPAHWEIADVFDLFPRLRERASSTAGSLSGGEQQMLTIAMAILRNPIVLMIDELSLGLAPSVVADLVAAVRRIRERGASVIVVEQSLQVAADLADRAVFLERGRVVFSGSPEALVERPDLARAIFFGETTERAAEPAGITEVDGRSATKRSAADAADPIAALVLEVQGVSRTFGGITALDDVDLSVSAHEILGLIGSNGAGKTTLLDLCSGFVPVESGSVELLGRDVTGMAAAERARMGLGRVFQDAALFPTMTVGEVVAVAMERHVDVRDPVACALGLAKRSEREVFHRVAQLLESTGLSSIEHQVVGDLSTGTRRVVEIACAMANRPSVLLLDEPSAGVAQRETEALTERLRELRSSLDASFVIVEHDMSLVRSLCDRVVCMHLGRVIALGEPDDVLDRPEVVEAYLGGAARTMAATR